MVDAFLNRMPICIQVLLPMNISMISTRQKNFPTRNRERKSRITFVRDRFPTNCLINRNRDFSTIITPTLTAFWLKRRRSLWRRLSVSPLSSLALPRLNLKTMPPRQRLVVGSAGSSKLSRKKRSLKSIPRKHCSKCHLDEKWELII